MPFTPEEIKLLAQYVTNPEGNIFALKNLNGLAGAIYARYSRAKGSFKQTLLKEFIKEGVIDFKHADELIARILVAYGDDSVGELEGAHVSFERVSMLATKEIEDRRIGGSPIEQSTRYVFYDQKDEQDNWFYYRGDELTKASFGAVYLATMDFIFNTYASLVEPMKEYFSRLKDIQEAEYDINGDGIKEKIADLKDERDLKAFKTTYGFDLRSKACDTLRHLLPLSTLTNVGMFGNGRFYQTLISHLLTTDLPEAKRLGQDTSAATSQVIPQYVKRAKRSDYLVENRNKMIALAEELALTKMVEKPANLPDVSLIDAHTSNESFDMSTIAAMLYPYSSQSFKLLFEKVKAMDQATRLRVIQNYIGERRTRRDRPLRALEHGYPYTFDLVTDWGVYKDLMRHRINTQQRQLFTSKIGFYLAPEIVQAGFEKQIKECVERADRLFDLIKKDNPLLAQYAVLHGNFTRWSIGLNDREAMHMLELRSMPQGHPNYRRIAQMMHREITKRFPWRAETMKFVDYNDYYWSRADSEARQRVKEKQLADKYGQSTPPNRAFTK